MGEDMIVFIPTMCAILLVLCLMPDGRMEK